MNDTDKEAVLLTLDRLSQTMEAMRQVVSRLKRSVEQAEITQSLESHQATPGHDPQLSMQDNQAQAPSSNPAEARSASTNESAVVLH